MQISDFKGSTFWPNNQLCQISHPHQTLPALRIVYVYKNSFKKECILSRRCIKDNENKYVMHINSLGSHKIISKYPNFLALIVTRNFDRIKQMQPHLSTDIPSQISHFPLDLTFPYIIISLDTHGIYIIESFPF